MGFINTKLTNIFYFLQYFSFLTAPYPEIGRKTAEGLAEGFISSSPVPVRNMACIAHAQLIHKRLLHQLQGDKQNSVSGHFAAQMLRLQTARGSSASFKPEGPQGAFEVMDCENFTLHHFQYKRKVSLSGGLVSNNSLATSNAGSSKHFKCGGNKAYRAIYMPQGLQM